MKQDFYLRQPPVPKKKLRSGGFRRRVNKLFGTEVKALIPQDKGGDPGGDNGFILGGFYPGFQINT
jgi:hypothetical protein